MIQLIAVSCLSLAAKMDEVNVPSLVDLQVKFMSHCRVVLDVCVM